MTVFFLFVIPIISSVLFVYLIKPSSDLNIKYLLAFSGAFLLGIISFHLLPEIFDDGNKIMGIFFVVGILIQTFLDFFSKGIEHGHSVKKMSMAIFLSICIHAFIEGMPIHDEHLCHEHNIPSNNTLVLGIILHKIPISIILLSLFSKSLSKYRALLLIVLFSTMTPLGYFVGEIDFFLKYHDYILAIAMGVLLHVSTFMIYENDNHHSFGFKKIIAIILGFIISFIVS